MDEYLAAHRGGGGGGGGGPDPTNSPDRVVEVQAFGPRRVGPNLLIHHPDRFVVRVYRESAPDASEASAESAGSGGGGNKQEGKQGGLGTFDRPPLCVLVGPAAQDVWSRLSQAVLTGFQLVLNRDQQMCEFNARQ